MAQELFDLYFRYCGEGECPTRFHRWSLLSAVSALKGRQVWLPFGHSKIFLNQFIILVGDPSAKKSTAISIAKDLLTSIGYDKYAPARMDSKVLLDELKYQEVQLLQNETILLESLVKGNSQLPPSEVYMCASELLSTTGKGNLSFLSLLTDLWDCPATFKPPREGRKKQEIFQPTVGLLGGATPDGMTIILPQETLGTGFLSRVLMIWGSPERKIAFPEPMDSELRETLQDKFSRIAALSGPMSLTPDAKKLVELIYSKTPKMTDLRFRDYDGRRSTHLLKLCCLCALMDERMEVSIDDVFLANAILTNAELYMSRAIGDFARSRDAQFMQSILDGVRSFEKPPRKADLWEKVKGKMDSIRNFERTFAEMAESGLVTLLSCPLTHEILITAAPLSIRKFPEGLYREELLTEDERAF